MVVALGALLGSIGVHARADQAEPVRPTETAKVRQLMDLLADPEVRSFLERSRLEHARTDAAEPATQSMAVSLSGHLAALRAHFSELLRSGADLPAQASTANAMARAAIDQRGFWSTATALMAFVLLGYGAQALFHLVGRRFRRWLLALKLETVDERVRAVFARLLYGLGLIGSYALGSIGAFLLLDWSDLIKQLLLGFLIAFLIVRLSNVVGRFLLAPGAERFRVVPISTKAASFLYARLVLLAVLFGFGVQAIATFSQFGFSTPAQELSYDVLALLIGALAVATMWRLPPLGTQASDGTGPISRRQRTTVVVLTIVCLLLLVLWIVQQTLAFWLIAFATGLPVVIITARASVAHVLRPAGTEIAPDEAHSFQAVMFERGVRSVIIISAALLLAWILNVDVVSLTMQDTTGIRIVRGAISVVVIGLIADVLWTFIRALIDRKMKQPLPHQAANGVDPGHAARLQTLLPIVSNILLATIAIVAIMMMLAAIGVQIGPLIASAGVVGVAVGFGAQTLVKDIISGIFYLVDDAFRIGEYIQSGNYKGTVESFSLRSVKLRHQRGALYTVPFGVLGAVQNQSRDWVVDKIVMNVRYDTDLDKVRKIIKRIGEKLSADPDYGSEILSPLKMQGVTQFGDYAIQIQTKMMTRPGDVQFMARRRALLLIKLAFAEQGIGFALPTVQVSGDQTASSAAAAHLAAASIAAEPPA